MGKNQPIFSFLTLLLLITGCSSGNEYKIHPPTDRSNEDRLEQLAAENDNMVYLYEFNEGLAEQKAQSYIDLETDYVEVKWGSVKDSIAFVIQASKKDSTVEIWKAINKFFAPSTCGCKIPKKLQKKMEDDSLWAPSPVMDFITDKLKTRANVLPGIYVKEPILTCFLKHGTEQPRYVDISADITEFEYNHYIVETRNHLLYTLDCSGYLNAALKIRSNFGAGQFEGSTDANFKDNTTMFLCYGYLYSPIYAALTGKGGGKGTDKRDISDLHVLFNLLMNVGGRSAVDSDNILVHHAYEILWTSKSLTKSFNGMVDAKTDVNGSFGVISASANAAGGVSIERKISFGQFDTYIIDYNDTLGGRWDNIKVKDVKDRINVLAKKSKLHQPVKLTANKIEFVMNYPSIFSDLTFTVSEFPGTPVEVEASNNGFLKFTIHKSIGTKNKLTVVCNDYKLNFKNVISVE